MRISDWSPDVCSSDLIDFLPSRKPNGIWSIPYSVRRGCLRFNGRLHGFRVLKLVASSLHLPLTTRARLFREWESLRTQPSKSMKRSEEHTSELPSLMRISYAVSCLKKIHKHTTHP